ncbi:hypothetical protein A4R43_22300 [Amycolatopsis albispora]|uniref:Uncharacterized protein n=1 Tax=Amycolatopsis albispora TaxID=1804986 RepID=A0A344LA14_9PSEU|nr:hypothetical protein A4R43_22300 [Amycolatopsis albispora]
MPSGGHSGRAVAVHRHQLAELREHALGHPGQLEPERRLGEVALEVAVAGQRGQRFDVRYAEDLAVRGPRGAGQRDPAGREGVQAAHRAGRRGAAGQQEVHAQLVAELRGPQQRVGEQGFPAARLTDLVDHHHECRCPADVTGVAQPDAVADLVVEQVGQLVGVAGHGGHVRQPGQPVGGPGEQEVEAFGGVAHGQAGDHGPHQLGLPAARHADADAVRGEVEFDRFSGLPVPERGAEVESGAPRGLEGLRVFDPE